MLYTLDCKIFSFTILENRLICTQPIVLNVNLTFFLHLARFWKTNWSVLINLKKLYLITQLTIQGMVTTKILDCLSRLSKGCTCFPLAYRSRVTLKRSGIWNRSKWKKHLKHVFTGVSRFKDLDSVWTSRIWS